MTDNNSTMLLNSDYASRQDIRKDILDNLIKTINESGVKLKLSRDELFLALDEAITNGMEHGNKWDPNKRIKIEVEKNSEFLTVKITDEGEGFDYAKFSRAIKNRDKLSIRGRGLFIIKQYCDISWNEKGNQLILKFFIVQ